MLFHKTQDKMKFIAYIKVLERNEHDGFIIIWILHLLYVESYLRNRAKNIFILI